MEEQDFNIMDYMFKKQATAFARRMDRDFLAALEEPMTTEKVEEKEENKLNNIVKGMGIAAMFVGLYFAINKWRNFNE